MPIQCQNINLEDILEGFLDMHTSLPMWYLP
jgi:hypothetical protein